MKPSDLTIILNGIEKVGKAFYKQNEILIRQRWKNSSFSDLSKTLGTLTEEKLSSLLSVSTNPRAISQLATEAKERGSMVTEGIKQYSSYVLKKRKVDPINEEFEINHPIIQDNIVLPNEINEGTVSVTSQNISSVVNSAQINERDHVFSLPVKEQPNLSVSEDFVKQNLIEPKPNRIKSRKLPQLSDHAKERKVPSSIPSRTMSYIGLALGMGFGAITDVTQRKLGLKDSNDNSVISENPILTKENINKIVDTLCKNRGAALKLGQMLSIQDSSLISPEVAVIFERVRQSADFMPTSQMEKVLVQEFGENWRDRFSEFQSKPFAAASIGQVHCAKLHDGTDVALKIQYPGVAKGIKSDINSLMWLIKKWNIVPKGMFLNNAVTVAKRELRREVDYIHEAEAGTKFKELLRSYSEYYVPHVYADLCTTNVLTTELVYGTPVDKLQNESQELRNFVCESLLKLCLMEIFLFRYMQTDPNWSNFLYNFDSNQIVLLDFGASNSYSEDFVDIYMNIIKAASEQNREDVLHFSQKLGFLTGYETKIMEEAHVDAVMILGEAFACKTLFNFKQQNMTKKIHHLVPHMLKHRLTPPPEETYSLHRKMSGIFLLCTKLGAEIDCSVLFNDVCDEYFSRKRATVSQ